MVMPMVWTASEDLIWAHGSTAAGVPDCGLCYCQKPHGRLWSVLPLTMKSKAAAFAVVLMIVNA